MIGVLHTARINAIEFIVSIDKLIKMVNCYGVILMVFGRSWVRFLSGARSFSLSRARVMLINSPSHKRIYNFLYLIRE